MLAPSSIISICMLVLLCLARRRIREKDQIIHGGCADSAFCDFCCVWCFPLCTMCQMLRHVTNNDYELCSETGTGGRAGDLEQGLLPH